MTRLGLRQGLLIPWFSTHILPSFSAEHSTVLVPAAWVSEGKKINVTFHKAVSSSLLSTHAL